MLRQKAEMLRQKRKKHRMKWQENRCGVCADRTVNWTRKTRDRMILNISQNYFCGLASFANLNNERGRWQYPSGFLSR
jgi:hypothetical protein